MSKNYLKVYLLSTSIALIAGLVAPMALAQQESDHPAPPPMSPGQEAPAEGQVPGEYQFHDEGPYVDPSEISNVNREADRSIKDAKRWIKKLAKKGGFDNEINELNQVVTELEKIKAVINNSGADKEEVRDTLNNFHQELRPWEVIQAIQFKFELPQRIAEFNKSLSRIKKVLSGGSKKGNSMSKVASDLGLNLERVNSAVAEMEASVQEAQGYLQTGAFDDAHEAINSLFEGGANPGSIDGALQRFRGIAGMWRGIKNQEVLSQIKNILQESVSAFNEGDYDEVHQLLNNAEYQVRKVVNNARNKNNKKNATANLFGKFLMNRR